MHVRPWQFWLPAGSQRAPSSHTAGSQPRLPCAMRAHSGLDAEAQCDEATSFSPAPKRPADELVQSNTRRQRTEARCVGPAGGADELTSSPLGSRLPGDELTPPAGESLTLRSSLQHCPQPGIKAMGPGKFSNWWVTDIASATPDVDPAAAAALQSSLTWLAANGARIGAYAPITGVSGFVAKGGNDKIVNPKQIIPAGATLSCLIWGAPHGCPSDHRPSSAHAPKAATNEVFKTNAWESISWLCNGLVIMTFPSRYKPEFWPRGCGDGGHGSRAGDGRFLISMPVRFHRHRSQHTGVALPLIGDNSNEIEMVVLCVPPGKCFDLVYKHTVGGSLNFGEFALEFYESLSPHEHVVELGCSTATLSLEVVIAHQITKYGVAFPSV